MQGGLGNQMFQYAFYTKLKKLKRQVYIEFGYMNAHYGYELHRAFGIEQKQHANWAVRKFLFSEKAIMRIMRQWAQKIGLYYKPESYFGTYQPQVLQKRAGFSFLMGYWQSEKYFQDISAQLRRKFTFVPFTEKENLSLIQHTCEKNRISLHIRRGDYVKTQVNIEESALISYCQNAIEHMCQHVKNAVFLIFSDDIPWCKKYILPPPHHINLSL